MRSRSSLVLLLLVPLYLAAALWPFRFDLPEHIDNGLTRAADGTLVFDGSSLARTAAAPPWLDEAADTATFALALSVRTSRRWQSGPARIFTISRDAYERDVTVAHDDDDLVVRIRRPGSDANGQPPFRVHDVFADPSWHDIEMTVAGGSFVVAVDGRRRIDVALGDGALAGWARDHPVVLGNEVSGDRGWSGEMRRAEILAPAAIDYAAVALEVPDGWWTFPRVSVATRGSWRDNIVNLIGFVPLGATVAVLSSRRRAVVWSVIAGALVSTAMEAGQVFTLSRDTSAIDVVVNIAGAALGGLVVAGGRRRRRPA